MNVEGDIARFRLTTLSAWPKGKEHGDAYPGTTVPGKLENYPLLGMLVGSTHRASVAAPDMNRIMCMEFEASTQSWKTYHGAYHRWAKLALFPDPSEEKPALNHPASVTEEPICNSRAITCYFSGGLRANLVILRYFPDTLSQFPKDLKGSKVTARKPATRDTTFSLQKNGVQFGFVTFRAGNPEGLLGAITGVRLDRADLLTLVAPPDSDDTLSDISISLATFTPTKKRPAHLDYLGDDLNFFVHMAGMGVYYDAKARTGKPLGPTSTVITREDWVLLREELEERGLYVNIDSGWKTVGPGNWD